MLSRQTVERQDRIGRLQQRVQQLQSQKPQGERAQREQQRLLQAQNRLLQREQRAQQSDLARQQRLGLQPHRLGEPPLLPPCRLPNAGDLPPASAAMPIRSSRRRSPPGKTAGLPGMPGGVAMRAAFVPWIGPVFWPYAYSDIFEYTFWPYAYDPGYWAYAYDDFVDTVFWGADSPYSAYASLRPNNSLEPGGAITGYRSRERLSASPQALRQLCGDPDKGITAWPIASIARAVRPTPEQRALLDELKAAAAKAADVFKQSCADTYAMTPPGRLQAMMNRISATLEAVRIVRPALEKFYNSLSDEQQARFNALGPHVGEQSPQTAAAGGECAAESCGEPKSSLTQLPIERIEAVIHPAGKQKEALDHLSDATRKAVQGLQAACPDDVSLTPVGRLEAIERSGSRPCCRQPRSSSPPWRRSMPR